MFIEHVAKGRNSMSGQHFDGLPALEGPRFANGQPVAEEGDYPFRLITYKEIFGLTVAPCHLPISG